MYTWPRCAQYTRSGAARINSNLRHTTRRCPQCRRAPRSHLYHSCGTTRRSPASLPGLPHHQRRPPGYDFGVVCATRRPRQGAAGEHLVDLDVLPMPATVTAPEHGDLSDDVDNARGASSPAHRAGPAYCCAHRAHRRVTSSSHHRPGCPAGRPLQSPHTYPRVGWIGRDANNPLAHRMHVGRDVREDDVIGIHLVPVCPTVLRAVDGARLVAGIEHLWIVGMEGQRPDIPPLHFQRFPVFATVIAAIGSALRRHTARRGCPDGSARPHLRRGWQSFGHTLPLSSISA